MWVPFDLGRPLGVPGDREFQLSVLRHAFRLFDVESGPVLESFNRDAPDISGEPVQVACPVNFNLSKATGKKALEELFREEIAHLNPWYDIACTRNERTTAGVCGLSPEDTAVFIIRFLDENKREELLKEDDMPDRLRMACEDIKAFYLEAVSAQPGQPTDSRSLSDWFWGETHAAAIINRAREICLEEPSGTLAILGKLLLVPRNQIHRFQKY